MVQATSQMNDSQQSEILDQNRMKLCAALACRWSLAAFFLTAPLPAFADGVTADVNTCLLRPRHLVQLGSSVFGTLARVFVDRTDVVTQGQVVAKLDTTVEEAQLGLDRY
ncbi:MAG TPA: hypothetical protein VGF36_16655, partial [Rhodopila sp.]